METTTFDKATQQALTPAGAVQLLKEGNKRFVDGRGKQRDFAKQVEQTATGQFPFAVVLACIDSRVPTEIVFDQGIGDIFSAGIAGNFVNDDILGSMEFACKVAGSKLVLVMGHTSCGAVKGACDHVELGNLTGMLSKIMPAVDAVKTPEGTDRSSANLAFVDKVAEKNVYQTIDNIKQRSPILKEMYDNGEIDIVGAMYSVQTGEVQFYQ
jgi:carbonic anhydrase